MSIQKNLFFVSEILRDVHLKSLINFEDFLISDLDPNITYLFSEEEEKQVKSFLLTYENVVIETDLAKTCYNLLKQDLSLNNKKKNIPPYYQKPQRLAFFSDLSEKGKQLYLMLTSNVPKKMSDFENALSLWDVGYSFCNGYKEVNDFIFKIITGKFFCNPFNEQVIARAKTLMSTTFDFASVGIMKNNLEFRTLISEAYNSMECFNSTIVFLKRLRMLKTYKNKKKEQNLVAGLLRLKEQSRTPEKLSLFIRSKTILALIARKHPLFFTPELHISFESELEDKFMRSHSVLEMYDFLEGLTEELEKSEEQFFADCSFINFELVDSIYKKHSVEIDGFFKACIKKALVMKVNYFSFSSIYDCFYDDRLVFFPTLASTRGIVVLTFQDLEIIEFVLSTLVSTFTCLSVLYNKQTVSFLFELTKDYISFLSSVSSFDINALSLFFKDLEGVVLDAWCTENHIFSYNPQMFLSPLTGAKSFLFFQKVTTIFEKTPLKTNLFETNNSDCFSNFLNSCMVATRFFRWIYPRKYEETSMFKECVRSFSQMGQFDIEELEKLKSATKYLFLKFYKKCYGVMPKSFIKHVEKNCDENYIEAVLNGDFVNLDIYSRYEFSEEGKDLFTNDCFNEKDARNVPNDTLPIKNAFDEQDLNQQREYLYFQHTTHEKEVEFLKEAYETNQKLVSRLSMKPEPKDSGRPFGMEPVCVRNFNSVVQNNLFKVTSVVSGSLLSRSVNSKLEIIQKALSLINENKMYGFKSLFLMTDFSKFGNSIPFEVTQSIHSVASSFFGVSLIRNYLKVTENYIHVAKFGRSEAIIANPLRCDNQGQRNGTWQLMLAAAPYFLLDDVYKMFPDILSKNVPIFPIFFEDDHMFVIPFHNSFFAAEIDKRLNKLTRARNWDLAELEQPNIIDTDKEVFFNPLVNEIRKRSERIIFRNKTKEKLIKEAKHQVIAYLSEKFLIPIAKGYQKIGLKMQDDKCTFSMTKFSLLGDAFTKKGIFVQPFKALQNILRKSDRLADSWANLVSDTVSVSSSSSLVGNHPSYSWLVSFISLPIKSYLTHTLLIHPRSIGIYLGLFAPSSLNFSSFPLPQTNLPGMYNLRDIDNFFIIWFHKNNVEQQLFSNFSRNIIQKVLEKKVDCCNTVKLSVNKDVLKTTIKQALMDRMGVKQDFLEESKKIYCKVVCSLNYTTLTLREHLKSLLPSAKFKELVSKICMSASAKDLLTKKEKVLVNRNVTFQLRQDVLFHYFLLNPKSTTFNDKSLSAILTHCFGTEEYFLYTRPSFSMIQAFKTNTKFGGIMLKPKRIKQHFDFISFGSKPSSNFNLYPLILNKEEQKIVAINDFCYTNNNVDFSQKNELYNTLCSLFSVPNISHLAQDREKLRIYRDLNGLQVMKPVHVTWTNNTSNSHYVCMMELDQLKISNRKVLNYGMLQFLVFFLNDQTKKYGLFKNTAWRDRPIFLKNSIEVKEKRLKIPNRFLRLIEAKRLQPMLPIINTVIEKNSVNLSDMLVLYEQKREQDTSHVRSIKLEQENIKLLMGQIYSLQIQIKKIKNKEDKQQLKENVGQLKDALKAAKKKLIMLSTTFSSPVLDFNKFKITNFKIPLTKYTKREVSKLLFKGFIGILLTRVHKNLFNTKQSLSALIRDLPSSPHVFNIEKEKIDYLMSLLKPTLAEVKDYITILEAQDCLSETIDWMQHHWEYVIIGQRHKVTEKSELLLLTEFIQQFVVRSSRVTVKVIKDIHIGLVYSTGENVPDLFLTTWHERYRQQLIEHWLILQWVAETEQEFSEDLNRAMQHGISCYAVLTDFFLNLLKLKVYFTVDAETVSTLADDVKRLCLLKIGDRCPKKATQMTQTYVNLDPTEQADIIGMLFALSKLSVLFDDFHLNYDLENIPANTSQIKYYKTGFYAIDKPIEMVFSDEDLDGALKPGMLPTNLFNSLQNPEKYFVEFQGKENSVPLDIAEKKREKSIFKEIQLLQPVKIPDNKQGHRRKIQTFILEGQRLTSVTSSVGVKANQIQEVELFIKFLIEELRKLNELEEQIIEDLDLSEERVQEQIDEITDKKNELTEKLIANRRTLMRLKKSKAQESKWDIKQTEEFTTDFASEVSQDQTITIAQNLSNLAPITSVKTVPNDLVFDTVKSEIDSLIEQSMLQKPIKIEEKPVESLSAPLVLEVHSVATQPRGKDSSIRTEEVKHVLTQEEDPNVHVFVKGDYSITVDGQKFVSDVPLKVTYFKNIFFVHPDTVPASKLKTAFVKNLPPTYKVEWKTKV